MHQEDANTEHKDPTCTGVKQILLMPMKQTLPVSMFDTHVPEGEHYLNNNNNDNYNTDDDDQ